jgi:hypothetical protein
MRKTNSIRRIEIAEPACGSTLATRHHRRATKGLPNMTKSVPAQPNTVENTVAEQIAIDRKSIQMKFFRDHDSLNACVSQRKAIALGMIVGTVNAMKERPGQLPNGQPSISLQAMGEFEAVNYKTGERAESNTAYLPTYFAEVMQAALAKAPPGSPGINIALEIVCEPTGVDIGGGKSPFSYGVKRLHSRLAESPLERIKRDLQSRGMLRGLNPPAAPLPNPNADPLQLADDVDAETGEVMGTDAPAPAKANGRAKQQDAPAQHAAA